MSESAAQSSGPVICFGQQPCGFFPKRFLYAKIVTARRLQKEIGGEIVFFYHDSDHDPRETRTMVRHRQSGNPILLNFEFENKWQRKFSPLYLKRVPAEWSRKMAGQLGNYVEKGWVEAFRAVASGPHAGNVADFCLDMYRQMGLLEGIRVMRSGDPEFRRAACAISDFFVDVPYEGEVVRARYSDGKFLLHEGGNAYITVPPAPFGKEQISPTRDSRLVWMQSVIRCTHYVSGAGEQAYLKKEEAPEISFVTRDTIERSDEAYTDHLE
ncbi:MAG: hypothetical protein ACTHN5_23815 [Phycisphaerae bacterium]